VSGRGHSKIHVNKDTGAAGKHFLFAEDQLKDVILLTTLLK
jgi:hypothetical protein